MAKAGAGKRAKARRRAAPRAVIVHSLDHARAALGAARAAGCAVALRSPPDGAARQGAAWFAALADAARAEFPDVEFTASLDCGAAPGHALGALREGVRLVRVAVRPSVRRKLERIAAKSGAALDTDGAPALDLAAGPDPVRAAADWLGRR